MAVGFDRFEDNGSGGFWVGLMTGALIGVGLGMLFAPKSGAALRRQLSRRANDLAETASDGVRRASEVANEWADRGRELFDKTRDAVSRGAEEMKAQNR